MNEAGSSSSLVKPAPAASDLFPLEVTPFEAFMLADDRPGYPMILVVETHFEGQIDRTAFESAFADSIGRHPLLTARIETSRGVSRWVKGPGTLPMFDWCGDGQLAGKTPHDRFDLANECGLRCWVRLFPDRSKLLWQFSHVSSDGVGAMQFLEDFMVAYARALPGEHERPEFRPLDPQELKARNRFGGEQDPQAKPPGWRDFVATLQDAIQFLWRKPVPLAVPKVSSSAAGGDPFSGIAMARFDEGELAALRAAAMRAEATLNDYLLALLFQTLIAWNREQGATKDDAFLRVLMPMNLRRREHAGMPAANLTGFGFLEKQIGQCSGLSELAGSIRADTRDLKRQRAGEDFIHGVAALQRIGGVLPWVLRQQRCLSSAVLTNLGDPTQLFKTKFPRRNDRCLVGNLELECFTGFTAVRPLTRASFAITISAGTMVAGVHCDPQGFSLADAQQLIDAFKSRAMQASAAP